MFHVSKAKLESFCASNGKKYLVVHRHRCKNKIESLNIHVEAKNKDFPLGIQC